MAKVSRNFEEFLLSFHDYANGLKDSLLQSLAYFYVKVEAINFNVKLSHTENKAKVLSCVSILNKK